MVDQEPPDNVINFGPSPPRRGGSGPDDPGIEARFVKLEADVAEIRAEIRVIRLDLAEIKGKLSSVPTT
jgi:hypothetical protein